MRYIILIICTMFVSCMQENEQKEFDVVKFGSTFIKEINKYGIVRDITVDSSRKVVLHFDSLINFPTAKATNQALAHYFLYRCYNEEKNYPIDTLSIVISNLVDGLDYTINYMSLGNESDFFKSFENPKYERNLLYLFNEVDDTSTAYYDIMSPYLFEKFPSLRVEGNFWNFVHYYSVASEKELIKANLLMDLMYTTFVYEDGDLRFSRELLAEMMKNCGQEVVEKSKEEVFAEIEEYLKKQNNGTVPNDHLK